MKDFEFCPLGERQLPAFLENRLSPGERQSFETHAASCEICRSEIELWTQLSHLEAPAPSTRFRRDFDAMLVRNAQPAARPQRPAYIWFAAAAALVIGAFFTGLWTSNQRQQPEISELRHELRNLRGMVAMGLLQQQSAVDRLRGVNYSVRLEEPDDQVVQALIETLRVDSSVDVRLAATDALRKYSSRPQVRQALVESLIKDESPLVQLSLIDAMVDLRERRAASTFTRLASSETIDPTVKTRLESALVELNKEKEPKVQ